MVISHVEVGRSVGESTLASLNQNKTRELYKSNLIKHFGIFEGFLLFIFMSYTVIIVWIPFCNVVIITPLLFSLRCSKLQGASEWMPCL